MILLAIDPGSAGGMAYWTGKDVAVGNAPSTGGDFVAFLSGHQDQVGKVAIVEEQVPFLGASRPGEQGRQIGMALRIGKMMMGYGFLLGALQGMGWRVELVRPQKWQKGLSLGNSKSHASKSAFKNHLKAEAQRLYPMLKVTLKTADALLILEYARRMRLNAPQMEQKELV